MLLMIGMIIATKRTWFIENYGIKKITVKSLENDKKGGKEDDEEAERLKSNGIEREDNELDVVEGTKGKKSDRLDTLENDDEESNWNDAVIDPAVRMFLTEDAYESMRIFTGCYLAMSLNLLYIACCFEYEFFSVNTEEVLIYRYLKAMCLSYLMAGIT